MSIREQGFFVGQNQLSSAAFIVMNLFNVVFITIVDIILQILKLKCKCIFFEDICVSDFHTFKTFVSLLFPYLFDN